MELRKFDQSTHPGGPPVSTAHGVVGVWLITPLNGFGVCVPALKKVGKFKRGIEKKRAAADRRLGAELLEDELFDWIVEKTETGAHAHLAGTTGELGNPAVGRIRAPRQSDARSKTFVIGGREAARHALITWEYQAQRKHGVVTVCGVFAAITGSEPERSSISRGQKAGILRSGLPRTKSLQPVPCIEIRSVQFPAKAVVQRQVRLQLVAILRKEIERSVAQVFALGCALGE